MTHRVQDHWEIRVQQVGSSSFDKVVFLPTIILRGDHKSEVGVHRNRTRVSPSEVFLPYRTKFPYDLTTTSV